MKTLPSLTLSALLTLGISPVAAQNTGSPAPAQSVLAQGVPRPALQTPVPLSANLLNAFVEGRNLQVLRPVSAQEVAEADKMADEYFANVTLQPFRFGIVRPISKITLSDLSDRGWVDLEDGRKLWTAAVRSPGAFGMRAHLSHFDVGDDTVLAYASSGGRVVVRGVYTDKGPNGNREFWTASLPGEAIFIEMRSRGRGKPTLEVIDVVHFDKPPYGFTPSGGAGESGALSPQELGCHLDPPCQPPGSFGQDALDASVIIGNVYYPPVGGRGFQAYCSGTVLKDLDNDTEVPYLLTAYHCINTQTQANGLEVIFRYEHTACGDTLVPNLFSLPYTVGAALLQMNPTGPGNDMACLRLNEIQNLTSSAPPLLFAEWSLANGLTTPSYGIHHPAGTYKRITFFEPSSYAGCPNIDWGTDGDYFLANATNGAIEKGSSGSGLFDFNGRLIGQLYGECGPGLSDPGNCASDDNWRAVYGKFWVSYNIAGVKRWMEIGGTINVDGAYPGGELGTPSQPFKTVGAANGLAWDGSRIKIQAGSYPEILILSQHMTILSSGGTVTIGR